MRAEDFVGSVIDLDTGERVARVAAVDPEAGLLERYKTDAGGRVLRDAVTGMPLLEMAKGRFRLDLRPRPKRGSRRTNFGAPQCARCGGNMTLPGDDLCPVCRAREQGRVIRVDQVGSALDARPCDNGCGRSATWSVSDETAVTPVPGVWRNPDGSEEEVLYGRGALVARKWYCSWCYQPPRILDARGEVMRVIEDAGGCRPE